MDYQVLDSDASPCRTGSSSVTSGELADVSSLSSKASSLQHSSGGKSGPPRPDFIRPSGRGAKSSRYRRRRLHALAVEWPSLFLSPSCPAFPALAHCCSSPRLLTGWADSFSRPCHGPHTQT